MGEIAKLIYSPFGIQLAVKNRDEAWGAMHLAGMALFDENGNRILPDDSISKENLEKAFTTLEVYADGGITLDYDNAFIIELK